MKKSILSILLILLLVSLAGCVQQKATEPEASAAPIVSETPTTPEPEPEPEPIVEAKPKVQELWCDPTELNIFVDPYIPVSEVSIFVNTDYDKDFGPNKVTQLFQSDALIGYVEFDLPENLRYSDLRVNGRFVN